MIYAVIDVGSNSVRLSIYRVDSMGIKRIINEKVMAGLFGYVESGELSGAGITKLCSILSQFRELLGEFNVERYAVFATQSLRGVSNRDEVVVTILKVTGMEVEIISGDEEAKLDFIGISSDITLSRGVMVDIGGGSTELVAFKDRRIEKLTSLPIGSLSLYKKYSGGLFPSREEAQRMEREAGGRLDDLSWGERGNAPIICGIGGTARAMLILSSELFGGSEVERTIPAEHVKLALKRLLGSVGECREALRVAPERTFTLLPGITILNEVVKYFGAKTIVVSRNGVREGYLVNRILEGNR